MTLNISDFSFLQQYYKDCRSYVSSSPELCLYADEKFCHSMQVVGAGNYLLKHEKSFQTWNSEQKYIGWQGCLFHDIGRFKEILARFDNKDLHGANLCKYDHGEFSYQILQNEPKYNYSLLTIPVRHHGHLDEDFFGDKQFVNATLQEQEKMKNIFFLIKDADKVANFYLFKRHPEYYASLICGTENMKSHASPKAVESIISQELCRNADLQTPLDMVLRILSWIFDLKFAASFRLLQRLDCVEDMLRRTRVINLDNNTQEKIEKAIRNFITNNINPT